MGYRSCLGTKVNGVVGIALLRSYGFRSRSCLSLAGTPAERVHPSEALRKGPVRGYVMFRGRKYSHKQEPSPSPPDKNGFEGKEQAQVNK